MIMKKCFQLIAVIFLITAVVLGSCNGDDDDNSNSQTISDSPVPRFMNVTIHDPSIFVVNGAASNDKFRIIGSFLASAMTGDFIDWRLDSAGGNNNTSDYPVTLKYYPQDNPDPNVQTMTQQIADVMRGSAHGIQFYASDIHRMPDGRFFHYYSLTSSWRSSAIGVAISNTADGPYVTQGLFVRSAEAGGNLTPDGTRNWTNGQDQFPGGSSTEPINHPNCIDAQVFFDKTGENFYMTYGSWSGGIFIMEIDPITGLLKEGSAINAESNGYGRKLIANRHTAIEAPYIIYSPESDYYYLFVSYGGLTATGDTAANNNNHGRYNLRIFRSRNPYGPYDCARFRVTTENPNPLTTLNMHPTRNNVMDYRNYGVKILGGYHFAQIPGENNRVNAPGSQGFLSPGHNSAYYDPATGKYFLIFHTRFVNGGEGHQVRVHEMFINEDGWLIASPFRYDAGTIRTFNERQLTGTWKILDHGRDNNSSHFGDPAFHTSQAYTFHANGTVSGPQTGTWELKPDGKTAHITLDNKLYKGLFLRCFDEYHRVWVYAFTALSDDGIALWGATLGVPTDLNIR
jgi:arabinan endo-1,5-alpha-L-arabinosidase